MREVDGTGADLPSGDEPSGYERAGDPSLSDEPGADLSADAALATVLAHLRELRARPRTISASDAYTILVACLLVGSAFVVGAHHLLATLHPCTSWTCAGQDPVRSGWPLGCLGVLWLLLARRLGPLHASAAEAGWLLGTPIDRDAFLAVRRRRGRAVALGSGLVVAIGLWLAGATPWVLVTAPLVCGGSQLAAENIQARGRSRPTDAWACLLGVLIASRIATFGMGTVGMATLGMGTPVPATVSRGPVSGTGVAILATMAVAGLAGWLWRRARGLGRSISLAEVVQAGTTRQAMMGALLGGDSGLLLDVARRAPTTSWWKGSGRNSSGRAGSGVRLAIRGRGCRALASMEAERLRGRSHPAAPGVALLALVLVTGAPLGREMVVVLLGPLSMVVSALLLGSLRAVHLSKGLRRLLPQSWRGIRWSLAAPTALVLLICLLLCAAVHASPLDPVCVDPGLATAALGAGLAGALSMAGASSPDVTREVVMTDAGILPVGAIRQALRGFGAPLAMTFAAACGASLPVLGITAAGYLLWALLQR